MPRTLNTTATKKTAQPATGTDRQTLSDQWTLETLFSKIQDAAQRLAPFADALRRSGVPVPKQATHLTPLLTSAKSSGHYYKCEHMTVTRAYKVRGALVAMSRAVERGVWRFSTSSTGNHALGMLKAAELLHARHDMSLQLQIVVPKTVIPAKRKRLQAAIKHATKLPHTRYPFGDPWRCV